MSTRMRLTLWHTALLALVLAGFAALVYFAVSEQVDNDVAHDIEVRALQASRELRAITADRPRGAIRPVELPTSALVDTSLFVQVVGAGGEVLTQSANIADPLPIPPETLRRALAGQEVRDRLAYAGGRIEMHTAPLAVNGTIVGALQVAAPLHAAEAQLAGLRFILAGVVLGALALAALIGWFLASRAMRPVDLMTRTARAIGHSADLSRRLDEPRQRDELGRLASTFNEMLARLDQSFTTQRRFLADASHELRSPLAAIRTNVEALLRGADDDPEERDASLRAIARETDRMGRLVADLLALAHADAGQPLVRQPVELDALLLEVYQQEKRLAGGIRLTLGDLEQVQVEGDPDRLKQLMLNLVDNALRYTPPGGDVTLDVLRAGDWAVLRVRDTGVGIPEEHLPRIFDRFYRVDRPRTRQAGGTGLGLAICKWVAEAHGGRVEVDSVVDRGSTFSVYLPLRPSVVPSVARNPSLVGADSSSPRSSE
jgi:two-component system OmpR family sensor kinase